MIDRQTIDRVMNATNIVDVVQEFVTLRKAGVNLKGLCPFHEEKTPSFVVSPSKQLCKCFSCGKGGNAVHFIMEHEQLSYPEAIKWLGKKYGIEVQEQELTDEEREATSVRESMFVVNEWARQYFEDILHSHPDGTAIGMAYFRSRGFRDDIIKKFQLGYCTTERNRLAQTAIKKGYNEELLLKTGLCYKTDDGRVLDRYHGRVIFPIHTISGKVVAFGGRILGSDKKIAKYVNSPESEIYRKSHELYGLYQAKHAIVKQGFCFLVEGYTDVISMHQSGIENVVASSGTSLTEGQIRLLHRFTSDITVLYDGDSAGIKASLRGIDMLLTEGLNVKVLLLPNGEDPDSFARTRSTAEFQAYIDEHQTDFIKFKTNLLLEDCGQDPIKRAGLITDIVSSISAIPSSIVRQIYIQQCATQLGVEERIIAGEVNKAIKNTSNNKITAQNTTEEKGTENSSPQQPPIFSTTPGENEEKLLIQTIIKWGEQILFEENNNDGVKSPSCTVASFIAEELEIDKLTFSNPHYNTILKEAIAHNGSEFCALTHFLRHPNPEISQIAASLADDQYRLSSKQMENFKPEEYRLNEIVPRLLHDFKHSIVRQQMKEVLKQLQSQETMKDEVLYTSLMQQYKLLSETEKQFAQVLGQRVVVI